MVYRRRRWKRCSLGIDAKEDGEIEGFSDRLAALEGRLEGGFVDGCDGVFIETEADGPDDGDFACLTVGTDDGAVESAAGDAVGLGEFV